MAALNYDANALMTMRHEAKEVFEAHEGNYSMTSGVIRHQAALIQALCTQALGASEEALPIMVPPTTPDLVESIRTAMFARRLNMRQVAIAAGISYPYMAEIKAGRKEPSMKVLRQLEAVLGPLHHQP